MAHHATLELSGLNCTETLSQFAKIMSLLQSPACVTFTFCLDAAAFCSCCCRSLRQALLRADEIASFRCHSLITPCCNGGSPFRSGAQPKQTPLVTIEFAGQSKTDDFRRKTVHWRINLTPSARQPHRQNHDGEIRYGSVQERQNLLVGEVWYASGQSNMQMTLASCSRKIPAIKKMVEAAPTNHIRFLRIASARLTTNPLTHMRHPS